MKRYVAYLGSRATNHIVSHGLGDWYDLGPKPPGVAQLTPLPLTATAFYYYDTWILAQAARLLGNTDEARQYTDGSRPISARPSTNVSSIRPPAATPPARSAPTPFRW